MRISDWISDGCSSDRSTVDQVGGGNDATDNQLGALGGTDITITQIGNNNAAGVTQAGTNNNSTISQTQLFVTTTEDPSNNVGVNQQGVNGDLTVIQEGDNDASVTQDALSNNDDAIIAQGGTDNSASLYQNGSDQAAGIGQLGNGDRKSTV